MLPLILIAALQGVPHKDDPVCPGELEEVTIDLSVPTKKFEGCVLDNVNVLLTRSGVMVYPVLAFIKAKDCHFILTNGVSGADFWHIAPRNVMLGATIINLY